MRFVGILSDVFLKYANDLNGGYSTGRADHSVLFRHAQQLIMHSEAVFETFDPSQTGGIVFGAGGIFVRFTVYT